MEWLIRLRILFSFDRSVRTDHQLNTARIPRYGRLESVHAEPSVPKGFEAKSPRPPLLLGKSLKVLGVFRERYSCSDFRVLGLCFRLRLNMVGTGGSVHLRKPFLCDLNCLILQTIA